MFITSVLLETKYPAKCLYFISFLAITALQIVQPHNPKSERKKKDNGPHSF